MTPPADRSSLIRPLFHGVNGFHIEDYEGARILGRRSTMVYGELAPTGVLKLLRYLNLTEQDVFYDLGSGVGKVVLQTAMSVPVKKCVGIEYSKTRCDGAMRVLREARRRKLLVAGRCEFRNEDFLDSDLSDATVIYTCSTVFPDYLMDRMVRMVTALDRDLTFVSLQEFLRKYRRCRLIDRLFVRATWNRGVEVFVYRVERRG